jgi:hypothetical protein
VKRPLTLILCAVSLSVFGQTFIRSAVFKGAATRVGAAGGITDYRTGLLAEWDTRAITNLADGDSVTNWYDSTVNGVTLMAGSGQYPVYKTGILNGLPVVRFSGGQVFTSGDTTAWTQPLTVYWVAKQSSGTPTGTIIDSTSRFVTRFTAAGALELYAGSDIISSSGDKSGAFHVCAFVVNNASSYIYLDGSVVNGPVGAGSSAPGANIYVGAFTTSLADPLNGDVVDIRFYSGAHSATTVGWVSAYLNSIWGTR